MKQLVFIFIIVHAINIKLIAQNKILDKPYIRESTKREIISNPLRYDYSNSMFVMENSTIKYDSTFLYAYDEYPDNPLKINDCVFFSPIKRYVSKYRPNKENKVFSESNEPYFCVNSKSYQHNKYGSPPNPNIIIPYSLRFYVDSNHMSIVPKQPEVIVDSNINIPLINYLSPFYFRKYEVTNKEYKEFVHWVRDSIARQILLDGGMEEFGLSDIDEETGKEFDPPHLNWEIPIPWDSPEAQELLDPLYSSGNLRFYKKRGIDSRKLNYVYYYISYTGCPDSNNKFVCREELNVYPDTLCWIHDFNYSFNEPMTSNYFWHPAYNDYPVVGVSYHQAIAFLHWKTEQHQKELDKKGIKIEVKYDLPTDAEWDIAATAEMRNKKVKIYTYNYYSLADKSWITDLSLNQSNIITHTDSIKGNNHYISRRHNFLSDELKSNYRFKNNFKIDGAFHTHKSNINLINKKKELVERNELTDINQDELGICFMGGNVSEWLKDSYQESWKPIFELRQRLLKTFNDEDIEILSLIEKYYDKKNHQDGKLVRGSNWYDERFSNKLGKNTEGTNAKIFVSPDSTYSTLGFRYVIHYKPMK
ncbi:MAG: SUMF1/EgtB/PvdO family nonheme iron enzyme [Flavobacteriales bacterium]|nr:SUMF1/EgtB/PvdO family nonheme iron enzyme [Flavobacteriales bacterium]